MYDLPKPLVRLLFLRASRGLQVLPELPACDPDQGPVPSGLPFSATEMEVCWLRDWRLALRGEAPGSPGDGSFDDRFPGEPLEWRQWSAWFDLVTSDWMAFFQRSTRREAWRIEQARRTAERHGLRRVIVLPVAGEYARREEDGTLVVSMSVFTHERPLTAALTHYA